MQAASTQPASFNATQTGNEKFEVQGGEYVHVSTGYRWSRDEDAPGYAWRNKKAVEEYNRAWEQLVDRDRTIGRKLRDALVYAGLDG